jgi:hypothetical protein
VQSLTSAAPGTPYTYRTAYTDQAGAYRVDFQSVKGTLLGPPEMRADMIAFVWVWPGDHVELNGDFQYVFSDEQRELSRDFRMSRVTRLTAGDDIAITIGGGSPICVNNAQDMHPWPEEWLCSNVHIVAQTAGRLVVTVTPVSPSGSLPRVQNPEAPFTRGVSTIEYQVRAGEEVVVCVELPLFGTLLPQSFVMTSSTK